VNTAKEWSDAELIELGNMLIGGLSIAEIARLLGRDHGDVRDKVVEVGRACRGSAATTRSFRMPRIAVIVSTDH